ncbi:MAG: GNAT family N-acetyltransferase [Acidimicrobiia bacterium]|nr:GNAT family N-acetyltransferase [Acidimicrobiia bacterium]
MSQSGSPPIADQVLVSVADEGNSRLLRDARQQAGELLVRAVGPDLADDRFHPADRPPTGQIVTLATVGSRAVAYVTAEVSRDRLQFDTVADLDTIEQLLLADADADFDGPAVDGQTVDSRAGEGPPVDNRAGEGPPVDSRTADQAAGLVARLLELTAAHRDSGRDRELTVEVWGRPRQGWHDTLAKRLGLSPVRTLYQMRCPLPLPDGAPRTVLTRPVDPTADTPELVAVNNRAFAYHPDQGAQAVEDVAAAFSGDGFDTTSVRILDASRLETVDPVGQRPMAGFCWTKIHPARPGRPALGEIYVIAVDPAYHGHGLGLGLTVAGLDLMAARGVDVGMLYVESDNVAAVRTYRKLGFDIHAHYTAWSRRKGSVS